VGIVFVFAAAWWTGKGESRRPASTGQRPARCCSSTRRKNRASTCAGPSRFAFNLVLTVVPICRDDRMSSGPRPVLVAGVVVALQVTYRSVQEQGIFPV
jgi:CitMHS family citrate-Mg2+:H+ or citrate-Ca2+:H+ symporter